MHDLLFSTGVLTLSQLSSLLQCGRGHLPAFLDALQQHGVLVQGCWVVGSHLLYPSENQTTLRSARDYLVCVCACAHTCVLMCVHEFVYPTV